jgi:hypothetical protein
MEIQTTIIGADKICEGIGGVEVESFAVAASGRGQGAKGAVYSRRYVIRFDSESRDRILTDIAARRAALPKDTYRQDKASYTRLMKAIAGGEQ